MSRTSWTWFVFALWSLAHEVEVATPVVARSWTRACYLSRGVPPDQLDPHLCTHLLVYFGHVTAAGLLEVSDHDQQLLGPILQLKVQNPALKVCLATGGANDYFAWASGSEENRTAFAESAAQVLDDLNLDGIDLDWEFPSWGRPLNEKHDFSLLLAALNVTLKSMDPPRLLSSAVGAPATIVDVCYEVPQIAESVDFVSIMTYDFHFYQIITPSTGHNAPLFASDRDLGYFATMNSDYAVQLWLRRGMPAEKLLMGIPTYARTWALKSEDNHGLYAPSSGPWGDGDATVVDVCQLLQDGGVREWDPFGLVPYAYKGLEWVSYEDVQSAALKAAYIRAAGLAGAMTFELDRDDWQGLCNGEPMPIHRVIRDILPTLE